MTIKACDSCFYGECERCTSTMCACCGEREVATVTTPYPIQDVREMDTDNHYEGALLL